jgi:predicted DNA-binding protein with PD1-like motif
MKTIKYLLPLLLVLLQVENIIAQPVAGSRVKRYTKVPAGYLMVLRQGEDVLTSLEQLAIREKIPSASLSGMGFVNIKFGFFNKATKEYDPKEFYDMELASMNGSIAWKGAQPSLHLHGVVTDKDFKAYGGHILSATVSTGSVEILVTVHAKKLQRVFEEGLGANVLQVE